MTVDPKFDGAYMVLRSLILIDCKWKMRLRLAHMCICHVDPTGLCNSASLGWQRQYKNARYAVWETVKHHRPQIQKKEETLWLANSWRLLR